MREPLSPKIINKSFHVGELSKKKALELLLSLIESSDDAKIRSESIETLDKIGCTGNKIFKILENCLVSDENAIVRTSAVKGVIHNFIDNGLSLLEWVVEHDKSPLVLKIIFDYFKNSNNQEFKSIKHKLKHWSIKFSKNLGIIPEELRFFLDIEALIAKGKKNYEINPDSFKFFQNLSDVKGGEPWLVIRNKHVKILNFNYYNWKWVKENPDIVNSLYKLKYLDIYFNSINKYNFGYNQIQEIPESIGVLTHLKKLILRRSKLKNIPESLGRLNYLEVLDLSYNKFEEIPQIIGSLNSLKTLNFIHNKVLKVPNSLKSFLDSLKVFRY